MAGVLSAGIYGATQIEALYDPIWYLREDSYPAQFLYAMEDYFPSQGVAVSVYVGERERANMRSYYGGHSPVQSSVPQAQNRD